MDQNNIRFNKGLIIDTNLLVLLIVGYFDKNYISDFRRTENFTYDDFEKLKKIVDKFSSLITTPQIITEVSNLCMDDKKYESGKNRRFRKFLESLIRLLFKLKEVNIHKNQILNLEFFKYHGFTDSCLIEIARKQKFNIITSDTRVYVRAVSLKIPCINFNHLRMN